MKKPWILSLASHKGKDPIFPEPVHYSSLGMVQQSDKVLKIVALHSEKPVIIESDCSMLVQESCSPRCVQVYNQQYCA